MLQALKRGDAFGGREMLNGEAHSHVVTAASNCTLLTVGRADFMRCLTPYFLEQRERAFAFVRWVQGVGLGLLLLLPGLVCCCSSCALSCCAWKGALGLQLSCGALRAASVRAARQGSTTRQHDKAARQGSTTRQHDKAARQGSGLPLNALPA